MQEAVDSMLMAFRYWARDPLVAERAGARIPEERAHARCIRLGPGFGTTTGLMGHADLVRICGKSRNIRAAAGRFWFYEPTAVR